MIDLWLPGETPYRRQPDYVIRYTKGGTPFVHVYPNKLTIKGAAAWRQAWLASDRGRVAGPVVVTITCHRRRPATHLLTDGVTLSAEGRKWPWPATAPDVDNVAKVALDGLKDIAMDDDARVVSLRVSKRWTTGREGTRLRIRELAGIVAPAALFADESSA